MYALLQTDITFLPGVGPKRAEILGKEASLKVYEDLLYYFPFRYVDRSKFYTIRELNGDLPYVQVKGKFRGFNMVGVGKAKRLVGIFYDSTGWFEAVWFKGHKYIEKGIAIGDEYVLFGKPSVFSGKVNVIHPELETLADAEKRQLSTRLQPVYPTTERMKNGFLNSKTIQKLSFNLFALLKEALPETLPAYLIQQHKLMHLTDALKNLHFPENPQLLQLAQFRMKFEELFFIQLNILRYRTNRQQKQNGLVFGIVGHYLNSFYKDHLPFELTGAQKRVIKEIRQDTLSGFQMNRLLQGDVGSGKTLVALMVMLIALDNDFQACLMAPTEILANQHYLGISEMLQKLGIRVGLLTGSSRKKEREELHEQLLSGELQILIGTHALIEDVVQFKNLGLVIIDEQHRFGVAQRAKLWKKNAHPPHMLVMTATPIPRTLAMTIYGDLDVSIIDELPPGRKPIKTTHFYENKRKMVDEFMKKEIALGRQIYIVFPLIQESETLDYKNLEAGYEYIRGHFPSSEYSISMVHGKMKASEKEAAMQEFVSGKTNIMVATTVIEVGVNVPNASVMVIESAERFGLSQLHQLRGRVGRGADQSYCILMSSPKLSEDGRKRMEIMVRTNDGFEIAESDLKMRGPGDLEGTQQSGLPFNLKIANLARDGQILTYSRDVALKVLEIDPNLARDEHVMLRKRLQRLTQNYIDWSQIS